MPSRDYRFVLCTCAYLAAAGGLVHATTGPTLAQKSGKPSEAGNSAARKAAPQSPEVRYGTDKLPAPVIDMREAILAAVRSGRIEDLTPAIQMNELKPDFGAGAEPPVDALRRMSADGAGLDVLAALAAILDTGYVTLPTGRDIENNRLFVWPYHAEIAIDRLTPAQEVELLRLVPHAAVEAMKERRRYTGWRIAIGADGVWHSFGRAP